MQNFNFLNFFLMSALLTICVGCILAGYPNPFIGTQVIKKAPPVNAKDGFSPFKHSKAPDPKIFGEMRVTPFFVNEMLIFVEGAMWNYNGKRFMTSYPAPPAAAAPPPQPSPFMTLHGPPSPPPPSYDEVVAARAQVAAAAAARGYAVYTYVPFYPGQARFSCLSLCFLFPLDCTP